MKIVVKKGIVEEIISKAKHVDDPKSYRIFYRDFDKIIEIPLPDFLEESNNFQTIPMSRVEMITKNGTILFEKRKSEK